MVTRVKICGITRWEDAQLAVELGAAALGFNFYPPSPRYIDPAAARAIILKLPPLITAVGIFANESDDEHVAGVAKESRVSAVQLHGPQFPTLEGALAEFTRIRAVAVREGFQPETLRALGGDAFLLDAFDAEASGRNGQTLQLGFGPRSEPVRNHHPGWRVDARKCGAGDPGSSALRGGCGQRRGSIARA